MSWGLVLKGFSKNGSVHPGQIWTLVKQHVGFAHLAGSSDKSRTSSDIDVGIKRPCPEGSHVSASPPLKSLFGSKFIQRDSPNIANDQSQNNDSKDPSNNGLRKRLPGLQHP
jgi:hypothetical protein